MSEKRGMKALELWCRRVTDGYPGVKVENMTTSWRDGLAFCALIHHFRPDLIDFDRLDKRDIYKNNELAFRIAERQLGIPALLDAEDMVEYEVPDRLSILTYLSQFYQAFVSNQQGNTTPSPRAHSAKVPEIISPSTKSQKTSKVGPGRLETCWSCRRPVFLAERLVANGKLRHRTCFTCKRCGNQLNLVGYYETENGDFVCETCPDEDKRDEVDSQIELLESKGDVQDENDEYSLNFEVAIDSIIQSRQNDVKRKFLQDLVENNSDNFDFEKTKEMSSDLNSASLPPSEENLSGGSFPVDGVNDYQHSTANVENLNVKIKNLLGRDFSDTLSLLNKEPDSFIADIAEIIDNIINDAVKKAETRVEESLNNKLSVPYEEESAEIELSDNTSFKTDSVLLSEENLEEGVKKEVVKEEENNPNTVPDKEAKKNVELQENFNSKGDKEISKSKEDKEEDYPEYLNPFAEDEEEEEPKEVKPVVTPRKRPVPASRSKRNDDTAFNQAGQKIVQAPVVNLNPFWSDGEPSSDEDVTKPVPAPRTTLKSLEQDSPFSRVPQIYGSFTSLSSVGSSASTFRRKKGPAPLPPSGSRSLHTPSSPESCVSPASSYRSPSPTPTIRSHRKSKPAPPPPITVTQPKELTIEKKEKNYENKVKQNLSVPDKSSYGKWKRKKGQAPALPIPQRRRITPLPLSEFYRELEDLEIQQRELERQGVAIEQTIRKYEEDSYEVGADDEVEKDVDEMILQLFDIVNQKNELFRRQAELMYMRRQQRLEEEHADLEYQIRCLMGRPERNKTDSDKAQEEELIRRLVEVVERRNEIIECLDMDRKREVEEDASIHHHLEAFAGKKIQPEDKEKPISKSTSSLLKYIKKKKLKKEKHKEKEGSLKIVRKDADKDIDEAGKDEDTKTLKIKKKWFTKPL